MINYRSGLIVLIGISLGFILAIYSRVLLSPNEYLFNANGDGLRSYYAYIYYSNNNNSNIHFEGLNYPYGEVITYTDCNPFLAVVIKQLSIIFPGICKYSIGIFNLSMISSFLISAVLLFLIFKNLKVHPVFSVVTAFSLMVLSPQVFRLGGHYALSYGFVIPLTIYLLLKIHHSIKRWYCFIILFLHILISFFTHPYLGLMSVFLVLGYLTLSLFISLKKQKTQWVGFLWLGLSSLIPIMVFFIFINWFDNHVGRTSNPYGYFEYYADFDTVLIPNHPPFSYLIKKILPSFQQTWEGWSYIGIIPIIFLLIMVFQVFRRLFFKIKTTMFSFDTNGSFIWILFCTSCIVLLFAFGFPFRFLPKHYLDPFSFIKQFRAIGRFAWLFFFIVNITTIYYLNKFVNYNLKNTKAGFKYIFFICVGGVIFFEGIYSHLEVGANITQFKNVFLKKNLSAEMVELTEEIKPGEFQAIIPLPYYHIGSENFAKESTSNILATSFLISYYSQTPLMSTFTVRTSILESKNLLQMFGNNYYSKQVELDCKSELPFLLVFSKQDMLNRQEQLVLEMGSIIFESKDYILLSLDKHLLFNNQSKNEIYRFSEIRQSLFAHNGFLTKDTASYIYYESYDDLKTNSQFKLRGSGANQFMKNDVLVLAEFPANLIDTNKPYVACFWIYNNGYNFGEDVLNNMDCKILQINNHVEKNLGYAKPSSSMIINNDWSLVEIQFFIENHDGYIKMILQGKGWKDRTMYLDEVFIYPESGHYFKIVNIEKKNITELFYNNHQIRWPLYEK